MTKTTIPADKFARALALVRPALEHELSEEDRKKGRVQPPTFERFLLDFGGGCVEGRGYTIRARARFGPPTAGAGRPVEVSVKLADLVAKWKGDVVVEQDGNDVALRCGKTRATLRGFPPDAHALIAPLDGGAGSVKLAEALLVAADIAKTAAHDESRAVMVAPDRVAAFGGANAILVAVPLQHRAVREPVYLGVREARALAHWLDEMPGGAMVGTSGEWFVAQTERPHADPGEGEWFAARCLNGARVPMVEGQDRSLKMVPHAHIRQTQLAPMLDRAAAIGADKLWVSALDGSLWLRGENRVGDEYAEQVPVEWIAGPRKLARPIAFAPRLLRDALAGFEGYDDVVAFQIGGATDAEDPVAFKLAPASSPTRARVLLARLSD